MNRAQKSAWFTCGVALFLLVFVVIVFATMFKPGARTAGTLPVKVGVWLITVFLVGGAAFVHWNRKTSHVDFDERDRAIKKNAVLVSFFSFWVLLFAVSIIPCFISGDEGSVPVCLLPIVNFSVFLIVMLAYSVAILVQYGRGVKGEKL